VPNIASRVSRTASIALSNIFSPILLEIGDVGGSRGMILKDHGFRSGVYIYQGKLTSKILGKVFDLPYKNIEWLLAAQ
jgi:alanine dehydrogenase